MLYPKIKRKLKIKIIMEDYINNIKNLILNTIIIFKNIDCFLLFIKKSLYF